MYIYIYTYRRTNPKLNSNLKSFFPKPHAWRVRFQAIQTVFQRQGT